MDIQNIRDEINEIDDRLVELFVRRMQIAQDVATYKKEHNLPVTDRTREREVIYRLTEKVDPAFSSYTRSLYQKLFELSKTYQSALLSGESSLVKQI
ncbi:MAG: chorismate mutase, partial [Clostridia bacterium]|nr:chorismate mutase [Clostridia bacterium]